MVEQWVSAALLVMVTRETAKPSGFAVFLAFTASLFSVTVIHVSQHFKLAWLQFTMEVDRVCPAGPLGSWQLCS